MYLNIIYGGLVMLGAMSIARIFEQKTMTRPKAVLFAGCFSFIFIGLVGALFWLMGWGFFSESHSVLESLQRVFGLATFVSVLIAFKVWNKKSEPEV